ncbi:MAG: chemotaxis protein CheW [Synergistaceae bacterium]|nr:chemotaxis protein CheW [Synergistaceae bacterium]
MILQASDKTDQKNSKKDYVTDVDLLGKERICLVFGLGDEGFGLDVNVVREIVRVPPFITRVPNASHYILGVINLRGTIVPVFDMELKLGVPSTPVTEEARIIIITLNEVTFGIIVNTVREVITIYESQIESANQEFAVGERKYVLGIAKPTDGRLIVLLDIYTLFDLEQILAEEL